jgi:DNA-binding beta-propeller fold protein YncE
MRGVVLNRKKSIAWVLTAWTLIGALAFRYSLTPNDHVSAASSGPSFLEFESGQVRPLAMSPDGKTLFAVNTPNGTLEIFNITSSGLTQTGRVPVGMEPVAVAARTNSEVWVVNTLSDSVSIVSLTGTPHVVRTLLVGDEPQDIVFAGSPTRAFISTFHRGQQLTDPSIANVPGAGDPQLTTPGVGRADVWVFDPANLGNTLGGTPLKIMNFFTDGARGLAVSNDGSTVFVAGFHTGNQTTTVNEGRICPTFNPNQSCTLSNNDTGIGGHLPPGADNSGETAPFVSAIVKFNNADGKWEDETGRDFSGSVNFSLPDQDVFSVNANSLTQTAAFAHVGTTLFNVAVNPVSGHVYVSNSDAHNLTRFESNGNPTSAVVPNETVRGHLAEMDITVINGSTVTPIHLNKQINYNVLSTSAAFDTTVASHSLSTPTGMAVTPDGNTLFVTAVGSRKVGVFNTAALENNTFDPTTASANFISVSGGGPTGLVLDSANNRLFVLTRFDDAVKVINLTTNSGGVTGTEVQALSLPNPEPASVTQGRQFLYEPQPGGNGEAACASCHIFGDKDELAWELGNPEAATTTNPIPINLGNAAVLGLALFGTPGKINGTGKVNVFHPMKGPQTVQTLRGMANSGAMHWRGDRSNGPEGTDATNETISFENFIDAFASLMNGQPASPAQMQAFAAFQLQVILPPNPVRSLDNTLNSAQQAGENFFQGPRPADGINLGGIGMILGQTAFTCNGCHEVDAAEGEFGTSKNASFEGIQQIFKIPHLRNMYTKVGMFGFPRVSFFNNSSNGNQGPQVRGFGFTNEGSVDTVFRFVNAVVFNPQINSGFPLINPDATRRNVEQYVLAFDTDLAPIVGQQATLTANNSAGVNPRINLMEQRCGTAFTSKVLGGATTECDLVAKVVQGGAVTGFLFNPAAGNFSAQNGNTISDASLRSLAGTAGQEVTFTAVPPGSGSRIAFGN